MMCIPLITSSCADTLILRLLLSVLFLIAGGQEPQGEESILFMVLLSLQ